MQEVVKLPYLLSLQANENQVESIEFLGANPESLQYIQIANLSTNKIKALPPVP